MPPSADGSSWTTCYEQLRQQVLAGDSRGPGLAVLLGRGMQAWLEVAASLRGWNTPPQAHLAAETGPLPTAPGECRTQLTAVLAGMVLHGWQQGRRA